MRMPQAQVGDRAGCARVFQMVGQGDGAASVSKVATGR